jgi:hypothetical protein
LEAAGVSGAVAQSIASGITFEDAAGQHEKMAEAGAVLITFGDPRYPQLLREIFDPPILLFARGRVELLNRWPSPWWARAVPRLTDWRWRNGSRRPGSRRPYHCQRNGARCRYRRA